MLKGRGSKSDSNVEHLVSVILITQAISASNTMIGGVR